MKKIVLILLVMLILVGCSSPNNSVKNNTDNTKETVTMNETDTIKFVDPVFEQYFRVAIGKLSGKLTMKDTAEIKQLDLKSIGFFHSYLPYKPGEEVDSIMTDFIKNDKGEQLNPSSLEDLRYFTNLEYLAVNPEYGNWPVGNIDFLNQMPNLQFLYIHGDGKPHDLSPLEQCKSLKYLSMNFVQVTDYSVFSKLDQLKIVNVLSYENEDQMIKDIKQHLKSDEVILVDNEGIALEVLEKN